MPIEDLRMSSQDPAPSLSLAEEPFSLISLHEPVRPAQATIVAVHGLGGDSQKTWTNPNTEFSWLKDGLAQDLPQFRVLTFHYKTIYSPKPGISITGIATTLLSLLERHLETNPSPIIFIAHSLGGLIVKQLFVHGPPASLVRDNTVGILFFGTPHRGSSQESWSATFSKISSLSQPDQRLVKTVELLPDLQNTNESWLHSMPEPDIVDFYETRKLNIGLMRNLIVAKESATLNLPHERIIALDDSHFDMVKFQDRNSHSYQTILQVLTRIVDRLRGRSPLTRPPRAASSRTGTDAIEVKPIDLRGYVHLFKKGSLAREELFSVSSMLTTSPTTLLEIPLITRKDADVNPLMWVHIPLNNTSWVNPCLQNMMKDLGSDLHITEDEYWLSRERRSWQKSNDLLHSRHFEPSFYCSYGTNSHQFVIYLPYLHWDSFECFTKRSDYLGGKAVEIPDSLGEQTKAAYRVMRGNPSLHPRRTLDQFFYSSLPETSSRDKDQVVSKNTDKSWGGKKMVMVDQLWLWFVVHHRNPTSTIFTCFPRKDGEDRVGEEDLEAIADLRQAILDEVNSKNEDWFADRNNFVGLVVKQAVNVILRVRHEQSLDFLGVFRAAIGKATDEQTTYFRTFQKQLQPGSNNVIDPEMKRNEVKLALEIADIIDELNSLNRVFEAQEDALYQAIRTLPDNSLRQTLESLVTEDIESYKREVKRMTDDARRTKESLMDLLDLQQKEESLKEAHYANEQADAARDQADETEAQSQILLLFTIVTIVFLPLSFFTSYYGMNVVELTGEQGNTNQGAVWRVMGPSSAGIIVALLIAAFFMYDRTRKKQERRKKEKDDSKQSALPC
ncbi:hypothetical protein B0T10DRAFT_577100 [Thelonectria olida]|uniref:DUF676 domain-containing protein n=1 Tax=Thelonectria olida TaxID=1576542 RepID=A0A9P8VYW7_9HYPO|nr:hypothetical protein B0T10DRAFT_577100 [Thelonectria olida]